MPTDEPNLDNALLKSLHGGSRLCQVYKPPQDLTIPLPLLTVTLEVSSSTQPRVPTTMYCCTSDLKSQAQLARAKAYGIIQLFNFLLFFLVVLIWSPGL